MADIATIFDDATGTGDWSLTYTDETLWQDLDGNPIAITFDGAGDLISGQDLVTAALISLFTDAEASDDDVIPDGTDDPRGWWGGDVGSKLWLRTRSKATSDLPTTVKDDISTALQWMIDDGVVVKIDVTTEWTRPSLLGAMVVFYRRDGARAALNFSRLWETV